MIAAQYAVHNAGTILFPAWVQLGIAADARHRRDGAAARHPGGGARLAGVFALPGAIAAGVIWLIFYRFAGILVLVPMGVVFAAIVLIEVLAVTELLGPAYERIDVTSVERAE